MLPRSPVTSRTDSTLTHDAKITRGHSCLLCRRRKVRCDGQHPCQNCTKSGAECTTPDAVPARRRKRKVEDLAERLKRCEKIIAKHGLTFEENDKIVDMGEMEFERDSVEREKERSVRVSLGSTPVQEGEDGKLIVAEGSSRYIESSLWETMYDEVGEDSINLQQQQSSEDEVVDSVSPASDYSSLIFGRLMVSNSLTSSHPTPIHIFRLWQTFIENIHPLTKIIHAPTIQQLILQSSGDIDTVSAPTEALMFAIYHCSVVSLDDQECQKMLGEPRSTMLIKYSTATQQALCNAKMLKTSNIMVLQALTLYLLSLRQFTDADTQWVLSGIAIRIGQRMGLHRESSNPGLSILEVEFRRRVWWQILTMEGRSSYLSGSSNSFMYASLRPSRLLNVNDSDLSPDMREAPREHTGVTEMLFCSLRFELGNFMSTNFTGPEADKRSVTAKIKAIDELEARLDQEYIKYCDPAVPLHALSTLVLRMATWKMRLRAHAPNRYSRSAVQPQVERDAAFQISLQMIEFENQGHALATQNMIKGFMWHVPVFFQLEALLYILSELRVRTMGERVDWIWEQIETCYGHHPEFLEKKNKLWFAMGNLCLKAWEERVKAKRGNQGQVHLNRPRFVRELYAQRGVKSREIIGGAGQDMRVPTQEFSNDMSANVQMGGGGLVGWDGTMGDDMMLPSTYMSFDVGAAGSMDWQYWQTLFDDCGVPLFK